MTEADRAAALAAMSTAEKIETVVLCYLRGAGTTSGACGSLVEFEPGVYRVTADGKCFIVHRETIGWCVSFKGFQGVDRDLCSAAANALDGGNDRDVSRNYPVSLAP
jgi:hypothetical protein